MTRLVKLWVRRPNLWMTLVAGGPVLQLGGCDPTVKSTVLTGIQTSLTGLVTALINAFFQSLGTGASNASNATTQSVVQAVTHVARNILA